MRVLYYYSTQQVDTGSPKALLGLVRALDRSKFEPLFLATGDGPLVTELRHLGVKIINATAGPISRRHPIESLRRTIGSARLLRQNAIDLVHVNEFGWNLDIVLGAALARVPVVLHVHNDLCVDFGNLNRFAARKVLFVSHAQQEATVRLDRIRDKSGVLCNAVNIEMFETGRNLRPSLGLDRGAIVVTAVCQVKPDKAVDMILEVARLLVPKWPNLHFVIVGPVGRGQEDYAEQVFAMAKEPQLHGRVHFLGSRSDIHDVLASSDIFFLPTRRETFGISIIEAMAASLPVVTTRVGGIPEIVRGPEEGYLLEPADRQGFVTSIDSLIADRERRVTMGRCGRASLDGRFDTATVASQLSEIYEGLLARPQVH